MITGREQRRVSRRQKRKKKELFLFRRFVSKCKVTGCFSPLCAICTPRCLVNFISASQAYVSSGTSVNAASVGYMLPPRSAPTFLQDNDLCNGTKPDKCLLGPRVTSSNISPSSRWLFFFALRFPLMCLFCPVLSFVSFCVTLQDERSTSAHIITLSERGRQTEAEIFENH